MKNDELDAQEGPGNPPLEKEAAVKAITPSAGMSSSPNIDTNVNDMSGGRLTAVEGVAGVTRRRYEGAEPERSN
jgi:hypothetical protein